MPLNTILFAAVVGWTGVAQGPTRVPPEATWVGADNSHLQYSGRVGFENPKVASFYYSGSGFRTRFRGRSLALRFEEDAYGPANSFGVRIDGGAEIPLRLVAQADRSFVVAVGLPNRVHDLEVYRRQDTYGGIAKFKGMWIDKGAGLEDPPRRPRRRIEFFGDSVMGGTGTMAFGYEAKSDQAVDFDRTDDILNNGYWGFGAIAARRLNADANIQGIGGLSLLDHTGWFGGSLAETIGLETTWDKLNPLPGQLTSWDFSRFTPDIVVIAVGQNDARGGDIHDSSKRTAWKGAYKHLLDELCGHYPTADFVLTTTVLGHDLEWDKAIQEVAAEYTRQSPNVRVHYFGFQRAGKATPGHPRLAEEEEMAKELANHLEPIFRAKKL